MERDITFESNGLSLAGTLCAPDSSGPHPAVLLITGSGQVDRDENARKLPIDAFAQIAVELEAHGIASLRFDKRGVGQSEGDFWETGFYDNIEDAGAALGFLGRQQGIDPGRLFLLGHSEGALIATRLAAQHPRIAGVVLVAGAARKGIEVLKWQAVQVARGMRGFQGWLIRTLHIDISKQQSKQLGKIGSSDKDVIRVGLVQKLNAKWFREFLDYDPAVDLPHIEVPVFALTGSKDIQVDPADVDRMRELVRSPFEGEIIPGVTHILRAQQGPASISDYKELVRLPVDPRVLGAITSWLEVQISAVRT